MYKQILISRSQIILITYTLLYFSKGRIAQSTQLLGLGQDDRVFVNGIMGETKIYLFSSIQICSEAYPAYCSRGRGGSSPKDRAAGELSKQSPPCKAEGKNEEGFTFTHSYAFMNCAHMDNFTVVLLGRQTVAFKAPSQNC